MSSSYGWSLDGEDWTNLRKTLNSGSGWKTTPLKVKEEIIPETCCYLITGSCLLILTKITLVLRPHCMLEYRQRAKKRFLSHCR